MKRQQKALQLLDGTQWTSNQIAQELDGLYSELTEVSLLVQDSSIEAKISKAQTAIAKASWLARAV